MARIFEALQHQVAAGLAGPVPAERAPALALEEEASREPAMPYIEVGGGSMDASPDVLNAAGARPLSRPRPESDEAVRLVLHQPSPLEGPQVHLRAVAARATQERLPPELIAFHQPEHPLSEQYRTLAARIAPVDAGAAALLVSGTVTGAGATTVLLNVAITVARQGRRVVVVDAEMSRPALAARLGLAPAPGLHEVMLGTVTVSRALQEMTVPNLHALTAGEPQTCPGWAIRSLGAILTGLRKRFDLVLLNAPPWTGGAGLISIATACDAVYLVLPHADANAAATEALVQELPSRGVPLRGCILIQR